ncbi:MAG: hypothetical protein U5L96_12490 [Owenweeksia sp.]|nr:hypothetical protein [Owenweeksia sp.]
MKKFLSLLFIGSLSWVNAQVYTPGGIIQGSSENNFLGVGEPDPNARVHIRERAGVGLLLDVGLGGAIMFGGNEYTDYPLELRLSDNSISPAINNELRARLHNSGRMDLGTDFSTYEVFPTTRLALLNALQVFNATDNYSRLQNNRLSWSNPGSDGFYLSFYDPDTSSYDPDTSSDLDVATFTPNGHLTITNSNPTVNTNPTTRLTYGLSIENNGVRNHDYALSITTGQGELFTVSNAGTVHIGSSLNRDIPFDPNGDFKLWVEDGIRTERVRVDIAAENDWADYVFEEDYVLMPIEELEAFIKEHKHLPGVPGAKEVVENGVDLGEMNKILLEKVEELTLHVIEQQGSDGIPVNRRAGTRQ